MQAPCHSGNLQIPCKYEPYASPGIFVLASIPPRCPNPKRTSSLLAQSPRRIHFLNPFHSFFLLWEYLFPFDAIFPLALPLLPLGMSTPKLPIWHATLQLKEIHVH
jgi:hypothetical protein